MSTQVAVQNTIRRVNDIENDLKKRQDVLRREIEESKTWWEGEV
ncbi:hypothetical protein [Acetivibrio saccincola]|uniref:Uncharacterized protein n=1 Tax=Acetivibrio saccincola TaxID=1677857 RepID=A0A2K9DZW1_9FIRM|nr:hypothetical protein [Acetivibrio saccincola]AUG57067.1 hypothetical protein HVS_05685 [Acetivibrio saccincola]